MKIQAFLRSIFGRSRTAYSPTCLVEPNDRGGWSLRWEHHKEQYGNYATEADALRIARCNFDPVRVVQAAPTKAAQPAMAEA